MAGYRDKWFKANPSRNGKYQCHCCKKWFPKSEIDIDHIVPQNRGGTDELWNLQAMCKHCNRSKQDNMSSTGIDLLGSVVKNISQGNNIDNIGGLAVNMVKKNTQNAVKKQVKNILKQLK